MGLGFALASYYPIGQRVASDDKPVSPQPEELNDAVNASAHDKTEMNVMQLVEDATSKAVSESLLQANSLFKRRQELLMMNKRYHESTNIHKTYGL